MALPGVGGQSRIAELLLRRGSLEDEQRLRERQLDQQGFGLAAGTGLDLTRLGLGAAGDFLERDQRAEQAALQREFLAEQAELDRVGGRTTAETLADSRRREIELESQLRGEQLAEERDFIPELTPERARSRAALNLLDAIRDDPQSAGLYIEEAMRILKGPTEETLEPSIPPPVEEIPQPRGPVSTIGPLREARFSPSTLMQGPPSQVLAERERQRRAELPALPDLLDMPGMQIEPPAQRTAGRRLRDELMRRLAIPGDYLRERLR